MKQALAITWGPKTFDYLVNNAGIGIYAPFAENHGSRFRPTDGHSLEGRVLPYSDAPTVDRR